MGLSASEECPDEKSEKNAMRWGIKVLAQQVNGWTEPPLGNVVPWDPGSYLMTVMRVVVTGETCVPIGKVTLEALVSG
jgi:hypothetical protein